MNKDAKTSEMERRIVYSLLLPAVRLAKVFGVPLKDCAQYTQVAYFHELRKDGMKLREVAELLNISMRSAARLSKQLKANFFLTEDDQPLISKIEFMLWGEPLSLVRMKREMADEDPADIERTIEEMLAAKKIVCQKNRTVTYALVADASKDNKWASRLTALNGLGTSISSVVYNRFFSENPDSFMRTLSFRVRRKDMEKLKEIYEAGIWEPLKDLDEAAAGFHNPIKMNMSIAWAEFDSIPKQPMNGLDGGMSEA